MDNDFEFLKGFGLKENPSLDLMGATPIGDDMEVLRERSIPEDLGFSVFGIFKKRKRVAGSGGAGKDEGGVTQVLQELRVEGGR